jgi:hypothetical protein
MTCGTPYATWLEDAGIPARVINELMGHAGGHRNGRDGSPSGAIDASCPLLDDHSLSPILISRPAELER